MLTLEAATVSFMVLLDPARAMSALWHSPVADSFCVHLILQTLRPLGAETGLTVPLPPVT